MIDAPGLAKVIIAVFVRYHGVPESIVTDWDSLFTSEFWSSLCYFLGIKKKLSIYSLLSLNKWSDRETKQYNGSKPQSIWQLWVR